MNQIDDIQLLPSKSRQTGKGNSSDHQMDAEDNSFEDVKSRSRRKNAPKTADLNKPRYGASSQSLQQVRI